VKPKKIYRTIPEYLAAAGLSQAEFAERLGISQSHLSQIISGHRSASLELAHQIEDLTGVPTRALERAAS
jgi:transcriptional regulator with XRE-family HTH domain